MNEEVNKPEEEVVEETVQENQQTEAKTEVNQEKNEKSTQELLQEERDKFLRLFAEFENYKKRTSKERIDLFKTASSALEQLKSSADQEILQGVELIQNKFKEVLKAKGLVHIEVSVGDVFNADIHEAITQIPAPSPELSGKVVDVVEQGYKLGERILRHPKVVVGKS